MDTSFANRRFLATFFQHCAAYTIAEIVSRHLGLSSLLATVLLPKRRLCFHLCLVVRLSVIRITEKTTNQNFMKFHGIVGHNPGISRSDFE